MAFSQQKRNTAAYETLLRYHVNGCPVTVQPKVNHCVFSAANSVEHELMKARVCLDLLKNGHEYVTEAVRNDLDEKGKERRVDVVDLTTGDEYEVETEMDRAKRFLGDSQVIIIPVGWKKSDPKWVRFVEASQKV